MSYIIKIETGVLDVHPLAAALKCQTKKSSGILNFTMKEFGQITPIIVVKRNNKNLIIDGIERYEIAKSNLEQFPTLKCVVIEIPDEEIIDRRIVLNSKRNVSIREKCLLVENVLGVLGKKPGVKREMIESLENKHSNKIKLDRFHFACHIANLDYSASTLRKLMTIFNSEEELKDELLDLIDTGATTIDNAFKVLGSKEKKIKESQMLRMNHFGNGTKGKYQLFNKSSLDMSEIENSSTPLFIFSPPYWVQRHYRNQGVNPFGREETVEEYIQSLMEFIREVRKKLKKNGVMVLIIGETYLNGYQGVCTKAETAIEKEGMKILDVNIWSKSNPKPTPCNERFLNGYEKIIVACNTNEKPVFNKIKKPSSTGKFKVIKGKGKKLGDSNYSLAAPDADITNVFHTSVFNKKEHTSIDNEFKHDAPAPAQIYETFIKAYSMPGDTVVDNFVGGGSVGVALRLGRNVIGFDIDPVNIDFCRKRFDEILGEDVQTLSIAA